MVNLPKLKMRVLVDNAIDEDDVDLICRELNRENKIDKQVIQFLLSLRKEAPRTCPLFEQFFFEAVEYYVLLDGCIDAKKVKWLRELLYADGKIDEHEMRFLWHLKRRAKSVCPEFQRLYDECM